MPRQSEEGVRLLGGLPELTTVINRLADLLERDTNKIAAVER